MLIKAIREIQIHKFLSEQAPEGYLFPKFIEVIQGKEDLSSRLSLFIVMQEAFTDVDNFLDDSHEVNLQEQHVVKMLYQMLCSLQFMHSAGIIHRDIKPQNFIIDKEFNVMLTDFGLARTIQTPKITENSEGKYLTAVALENSRNQRLKVKRRLSNHITTRNYRPPEIILLEKEYDSSVDLWGLGCCLAEIAGCT